MSRYNTAVHANNKKSEIKNNAREQNRAVCPHLSKPLYVIYTGALKSFKVFLNDTAFGWKMQTQRVRASKIFVLESAGPSDEIIKLYLYI